LHDKHNGPPHPVTNSRHLTAHQPNTLTNTPLTSRNSELQLELGVHVSWP